MSCPRLVIDLDKIEHNAKELVSRLGEKGIGVSGVTKAVLGCPSVADAMLRGGVDGIGESRLQNVSRLRSAALARAATCNVTLIRSPMLSQIDDAVAMCDASLNSELVVLRRLAAAAVRQGRSHGVWLMIELGDLREGAMVDELPELVAFVLDAPSLELRGVGSNLACQSGVAPDDNNMRELSDIVERLEAEFAVAMPCVSGGNSASLHWALNCTGPHRVTNLRLGEAILLGLDPLYRQPIARLYTDAVVLVGEVIEAKVKPVHPWGTVATTSFGVARSRVGSGTIRQALVALGRQDIDPDGLTPPLGLSILGASSDHLVLADVGSAPPVSVGDEIQFGLDYAALLRAATSPFVETITHSKRDVLAA